MSEATLTISSNPPTEQTKPERPWEQDRTTHEHPIKPWRRALQSPDPAIRRRAKLLLGAVVVAETLGAAGAAIGIADALLPGLPDTGLVPHPAPGIEPTPPTP